MNVQKNISIQQLTIISYIKIIICITIVSGLAAFASNINYEFKLAAEYLRIFYVLFLFPINLIKIFNQY